MYSKVIAGRREHDFGQHQTSKGERWAFTVRPCPKTRVTRANVNAWEMELSAPTAQYLVALAQLFHTTTDDILGLESEEQIVLRDMNEQEKRLVYDLVSYIAARKETVDFSGKSSKNSPSEKNHSTKGSAVKKI